MLASELIGKKAIRTTHTTMAGGTVCRSFMDDPIIILKVTDSHIVYRYIDKSYMGNEPYILTYEYCDDNWIDYDELIKDII